MQHNGAALSAGASEQTAFRVLADDNGSIEVAELNTNDFQLGPILRKYTAAKLTVKGMLRTTKVELTRLFDALGLLRSLQYDVAQFNTVCCAPTLTPSAVRYACYRLTRQAAAFGVRAPRPNTGIVVRVPGLDDLLLYVEAAHANVIAASRSAIAGGAVEFDGLAEFFVPGVDVVDRGAATGVFGVPTVMRVRACFYSRGKSLFGVVSTFFVALEFVICVGERFAVLECTLPIAEYSGTRSTQEGLENCVALRPSLKEEIQRRGATYTRMAAGSAAFFEYAAGAFTSVQRPGTQLRAPSRSRGSGRLMVDARAAWGRGVHAARSEGVAADVVKGVLKLMTQRGGGLAAVAVDDNESRGQIVAAAEEEESLALLLLTAPLPETLELLTWPVVAGYSFDAKSWGVALVAGLRDVTFNEHAFERLVMPQARKNLIRALVSSHGSVIGNSASRPTPTTADVIAGKGEGVIFLLYGPPGCGKTLTAEAIAEVLHKPLYVVSMGELGTTPEALEERLRDILELCEPWRALVLIDEAEMLLEKRNSHDIVRNAMVCVMLRLLEYYKGILFLTTNRVESLDPAFQSRVQCALRYSPLDTASRARIWNDLLERRAGNGSGGANTPPFHVSQLASHELNGRQIKNTMQLAMTLCQYEGVPLAQRHLDAMIEVTAAFVDAGNNS